MGGKNSTPPPPPDYRAAAIETANSNQQQNTAQTWANRPNMVTPFGSSTWTSGSAIDPSTGLPVTNWTNNVSLTPEQQHALTQQQGLQSARSDAATGLLGRATDAFGQQFSSDGMANFYDPSHPATLNTNAPGFSAVQGGGGGSSPGQIGLQDSINNNSGQLQHSIGAPGQYSDSATQAIMGRLQPMQDRQEGALRTQLANQGIQQGSEAYSNAMRDFGTQVNDARLGAIGQGLNQGNIEFGQGAQAGGFHNAATAQEFGQGAQTGEFTNAARNAQFQQAASAAQIGNQASQFDTNSRMAATGQNNQALAQRFQMGNQALAQQQDMNQNYGSYASQLRSQQMQEAMMRRNMPLNEMNAFLSGQQVQNPSFSGPNSTANRAAGTDFSGAAGQQNSADMARYQMQQQAQNSQTSGLTSLAGTAAMMMF